MPCTACSVIKPCCRLIAMVCAVLCLANVMIATLRCNCCITADALTTFTSCAHASLSRHICASERQSTLVQQHQTPNHPKDHLSLMPSCSTHSHSVSTCAMQFSQQYHLPMALASALLLCVEQHLLASQQDITAGIRGFALSCCFIKLVAVVSTLLALAAWRRPSIRSPQCLSTQANDQDQPGCNAPCSSTPQGPQAATALLPGTQPKHSSHDSSALTLMNQLMAALGITHVERSHGTHHASAPGCARQDTTQASSPVQPRRSALFTCTGAKHVTISIKVGCWQPC